MALSPSAIATWTDSCASQRERRGVTRGGVHTVLGLAGRGGVGWHSRSNRSALGIVSIARNERSVNLECVGCVRPSFLRGYLASDLYYPEAW